MKRQNNVITTFPFIMEFLLNQKRDVGTNKIYGTERSSNTRSDTIGRPIP